MGNVRADDFYEEDEPVEDVVAAFDQGEKGRTRRPANGVTEYLTISGVVRLGESVSESRTTVNLVAS